MSTQRGNVKKSKPPKHTNKMGFKNSMHDTSKKTKELNDLDTSVGVCVRCKDVLEWKIKYKKYKALTQPKKCTKCQQKRVKHSYHIICTECREAQGICGKCGQKVEEEQDEGNRAANDEEMRQELAYLSERERRTYLRAQTKGSASRDRSKHKDEEESDEEEDDDEEENIDDHIEERGGIGNGQHVRFQHHEPIKAV